MEIQDLAKILHDMYIEAPKGDQVAKIILFGITYHKELEQFKVKDIVERSGISPKYVTEVSKGRKLAKYVVAMV